MGRGWRWIDRRIADLDPEVDYVEIVQLTNLYRMNRFVAHWGFAAGSPVAGINPAATDQVWRDGNSTSAKAPHKRVEDSNGHLLSWLEHGPDHEATRISIEMVNQYHAHFGKGTTSGLGDPEEYVFIMCLNATLLHTLQRRLGFAGFSPKEQRATQLAWARIAQHFRLATDGSPVLNHTPFPDSFDGMLRLVDDWIDRPWPESQSGHSYTTQQMEHFARTWFPKPLWPLGRAIVSTFLPPQVRRVQRIATPNLLLRTLAVGLMKSAFFFSTRIAPDPTVSYLDRRRMLAAADRDKPSEVDVTIHRKLARHEGGLQGMCPHAPAFHHD
ncbi:oxygenase MpaB family protein [Alteraurantiacibacter buctensis]|uniref:ER-bound oxygenase mpaB/mpaB'/Rubber oxygenase catalytic domain-containing protein n=1 Tax=Alteraurantiacibacter buctensis TaxID=1503981 RepID=A0A844YZP1_9SPHN|nr:oxygenase MpaB family protein [Alteraurantiacibacter buctensis]MXO73029.1 hypothetical protein [Alteraurantiacibacter buctensis]